MKNIFYPIVIIGLLLASCASSSKELARGSHEAAFEKAIRKLSKKPSDSKELAVLKTSYAILKDRAQNNLTRLLNTESSEALLEALYVYKYMQKYSERLDYLSPNVTSKLHIEDYTAEISTLTGRASNLLFAEAEALLENNNKLDAQIAHDKLYSIQHINPHFQNLNTYLKWARENGTFTIAVDLEDYFYLHPEYQLSQHFEKDVFRTLNHHKWINYNSYASNQVDGSLELNIDFLGIQAIPAVSNIREYTKQKEFFEYVLDENGNVKKDSLGNDIRIIKYKPIKARVVEEVFQYDLTLSGNILMNDYFSNSRSSRNPLDFIHSHHLYRYHVIGSEEAIDDDLLKDIRYHNSLKPFEQQAWFESNKYRVHDYITDALRKSTNYFHNRFT